MREQLLKNGKPEEIKTGLTPEVEMGEANFLRSKTKNQQQHLKTLLKYQIGKREEMEKMEKEQRIQEELMQIEENKQAME